METTINMRYEVLEILDYIAMSSGKSRGKIIKIAVKCFESDKLVKTKYFETITYQDNETEWKKFHFVVTPSEYEHFIDMRVVYKLSFSLIVALALLNYLDILMGEVNSDKYTDNSPFPIYSCIEGVISNTKFFLKIWGKIEEMMKFT